MGTLKGCIGKVIAPCGIHWLCRCQCLHWWRQLSQVSTAGSGRPWSNGSQSLPLPHDHQMWGPGPGGHKGGPLMCWCRTGRTQSCRTPGLLHSTDEKVGWVSYMLPNLFSEFNEFSRAYLDPTIAPISNNDISIGIHSHTCWSIELAVPLSMGAKFKQELPICIVHLQERLNRKDKGRMTVYCHM